MSNKNTDIQREEKEFWIIECGRAMKEKGYSCQPNSNGYWYFPRINVSTNTIYEDKWLAIHEANIICDRQISYWKIAKHENVKLLKEG